jgi:hypothetical protein
MNILIGMALGLLFAPLELALRALGCKPVDWSKVFEAASKEGKHGK